MAFFITLLCPSLKTKERSGQSQQVWSSLCSILACSYPWRLRVELSCSPSTRAPSLLVLRASLLLPVPPPGLAGPTTHCRHSLRGYSSHSQQVCLSWQQLSSLPPLIKGISILHDQLFLCATSVYQGLSYWRLSAILAHRHWRVRGYVRGGCGKVTSIKEKTEDQSRCYCRLCTIG